MTPSSWYVYMLRCADNSLYTGITTDISRRVKEHNNDNKLGAKYTRVRRPVTLVYQQNCLSRSDASINEYRLKKLNKKSKESLVSFFSEDNHSNPVY
jgi:putative endonuclease